MYECGLMITSCKGEDKHQSIVESETSHRLCTVEGALAVIELLIGLQQTTRCSMDVLYNKLIAAIRQEINSRISIARIKMSQQRAVGTSLQVVVDSELKQQLFLVNLTGECEGRERRKQGDGII